MRGKDCKMLTTVSLANWMVSEWRYISSSSSPSRGKCSWSQEVENICSGDNVVDKQQPTERTSPNNNDDVYLENATIVAFLLVQQLLTINETSSGGTLDVDGIAITLEINQDTPTQTEEEVPEILRDVVGINSLLYDGGELCTIKFVNAVLQNNVVHEQRHLPFVVSLGKVLLQLFSGQTTLSNWEDIISIDIGGDENDDSSEFETDMMRALAILDNDGGGKGQQLLQGPPQQKQQRHDLNMKTYTYSRIRSEYPSLPTTLCRLISDIIDMPSRTKTSFASLNVILDDLEQMIIEPNTFLHRPAILGSAKFDLGKRLYGRELEVSQLIDIANGISSREQTGPLECVSVRGYSGSGKSHLVRQVSRYLSSNGWMFISGKFDLNTQRDSFSIVTSSLNRFCSEVQEMKNGNNPNDVTYYWQVSKAILDALGRRGIEYLADIMPSLSTLVEIVDLKLPKDGDPINDTAGKVIVDQHSQRQHLLCVFMESILSVGRSIILFYDDIQWADEATIDFLRQLLKHLADRQKPLLFIQAFRDNKVTDNEMYVVSSIASHDSVQITEIKVGGLKKSVLNDIISPLFCLPRHITLPLAEMVHQKSMGNIFFVIEFLKTLMKMKIVTYNLAEERWIWDLDSISILTISDDVAGLLLKKLQSLDKNLLNSLMVASCFGSQVNISVMTLLNGMRQVDDFQASLNAAVDERLLEKAGPLYMFAHDLVQQSVYELIPQNELIQLHVDIGLLLISKGAHAPRDVVDECFPYTVSHINMALSICNSNDVTANIEFSTSQRYIFAKLNRKVGNKGLSKLDYSLAETHFNAGLRWLPENSWTDSYELTLQLFDEYCSVLFAQRKFDELSQPIDIILNNARCIDDTIKAHELKISSLSHKDIHKAFEHARSVLASLGFPFPSSIDRQTVSQTASSLSLEAMALTAENLRAYPLMTEKISLQAMGIMNSIVLHMPFHFAKLSTFQMITCQMMQLTLKQGVCIHSLDAFANFGFCLNSLFKNYEAGYRMGKLSLVILERLKATYKLAKVSFIVYGLLCIWKEPIQACIEGLQHSINAGLLEGEYTQTIFNRTILHRQMLFAGCDLTDIRERLISLCRDLMTDRETKTFLAPGSFVGCHPLLCDLYLVLQLTGESEDGVKSIFGISRQENETLLLERFRTTGQVQLAMIVFFSKFMMSFWYRDYKTAMKYCQQYSNLAETTNLLTVTDFSISFLGGICAFILARTNDQTELMAKGNESLRLIQSWSKMGSEWNGENKALLLEAEYHFSTGNIVKAKTAYNQSIHSAGKHNFIHEKALACELFGLFYIEQGDIAKGNELLQQASELYHNWGATKKAQMLRSEVRGQTI